MTLMSPSRCGIVLGFVVFLATSAQAWCAPVQAPLLLQAPVRVAVPQPSAKSFLDQIYRSYLGNSAQNAKGITLANAATVKRYFSPGLASLILDDGAEAKKRGTPPTLAGDAFVGHQAWDIGNLAIDVKETGAKATGTVSFINAGRTEKVVLELMKVGEAWRIADIAWESGTLRGLYRQKWSQSMNAPPQAVAAATNP